ncbi:MAG: RHS repeat protein [Ruminiclostridium sp.]|nr:RHS repeat protein [Ruminiclostridium sp.]
MKKWIMIFIILVIFSCLSATAFASTSSTLQEDEITNALKTQAGDKYSPPFAKTDTIGEKVSTATGEITLTQTDLALQGKNGLDLVIKRKYSNRDKNQFVYNAYNYDNTLSYWYTGVTAIAYLYRDNNGISYYIKFESETQMLEEANDSIIGKIPADWNIINYNGVQIYTVLLDDSTKTLTRVKTVSPINIIYNDWWAFSRRIDNPNPYEIGSGWSLDLPYLRCIYEADAGNYQRRYNGEFSNGEGALYIYMDNAYRDWDSVTQTYVWGIGYLNIYDQVEYSGEIKVINSRTMDIEESGLIYNRIITDKNGKKMYYNSKGVIVAIEDRFKNRIKFDYDTNGKLFKITDTLGRIINIATTNGMIRAITVGDRSVTYDITENGIIGNEIISTLSVKDLENSITQFKMAKKEPFYYNYTETDYGKGTVTYNIKEMTYPTGAKTYYPSYIKVKAKYTQEPGYLTFGKQTVYKLQTRYDVSNNSTYNYYTYTYDHPYEGISKETIRWNYTSNYTFKGTITRQFDGYAEEHKYNVDGQKIQVTNTGNDGCKTETVYSYIDIQSYRAPATVTTTEYNRANQQLYLTKTKNYQYDNRQNIINETEGNYSFSYTYDQNYGILLTKSYKRDADHGTYIENTLYNNTSNPSDPLNGKRVEWERVYERLYQNGTLINTILKSEKKYEYDSYGNVTAEHLWPETGVEIVNRSQYTYNADSTWKLRTFTENVKDADGLNAHTVAREAYYDYYGDLWKAIDGKGNQTVNTYDKLHRLRTETYYEGTAQVVGSKSVDYIMPNNYILIRDENQNYIKRQFDQLGRLSGVYASDSGASNWTLLASYQYDEISRTKTETLFRKYNTSGQAIESYTKTYTYNTDGSTNTETTKDISGNIIKGLNYSYQEAMNDTINGITDKYAKITVQQTGDATITPAPLSKYLDKMGRMVKEEVVHNDSGVQKTYKTTYKYDFIGNNTETKDARAYDENLGDYSTKYEYDYANRATKETNILGYFTTTVYDNTGRVKSKSDYLGRNTEYTYDSLNRPVKVTAPFEMVQSITKNMNLL